MQITKTLHEKAQALVDDGKVTRVKGTAFIVVGTTGTYSVWLADPENVNGRCECPSTALVCSHILAAAIFHLAFPEEPTPKPERDPFDGLT